MDSSYIPVFSHTSSGPQPLFLPISWCSTTYSFTPASSPWRLWCKRARPPHSSLVSPSPKPSIAKCRGRTRRPSGSAETAVVKCGECFSRKFKAKAALTGSPCVVIEMPYERNHQQGKFCQACYLHGFTISHERIFQVPEEHREKIKEQARSINQSNGNGTTRHWGGPTPCWGPIPVLVSASLIMQRNARATGRHL